ncbi:ABC transporter ATP-binding protein [Paraburkholderia silvatlantica]|uniref:ABC transporter ATP-binding protein n=1 Tax=Paraburkholderia silvatlantica TaxID=321895 RepID=UPI000D5F03EE|nr:ABC transporter ATP-binding protein [Paraburkholderia silvatlantica]PVY26878.1 ATP-binding cassette subfamily B protein [Paraburkholderia silvatlantica]PXW33165.1 ATP-binding cassette subfamily B protein [Paraburkholderia silvatlantica]
MVTTDAGMADGSRQPDTRGRRAKALIQYANHPVRLLWRYVAAHPYGHAMVLASITAAVGCALGAQFAIRNLVDALPAGHAHPARVVDAFLVIVALLFADNLFWRLAGLAGVRTFVAVTGDVRRELFGYLTGHSPAYFSNAQPGTLASRIAATANALFTIENTSAWSAIPTFLTVVGAVALIGWVNVGMAFALVVISTFMTVFLFWLARKGSERHLRFATRAAFVDGELVDLLGNMSTIKAFDATARECLRFGNCLDNEVSSRQSSLRHLEKLRLVHAVLTVVLSSLLLGWVVWLWNEERATTGDVVLVSSLGFAILHGTRDLAVALVDMTQHVARLAEAAQFLLVPREMEQRLGLPNLDVRDANIDFENISFSYPGRRRVLDHFSLHIDAGQRVGLVGPSGAGKSTVLALLLRWFDPPAGAGAVCISGQRLSDVSLKSLHDAVSFVPQDISLFNRSLLDNLRYGRPEATEKEVLRACEHAGCLELILALPDGLHAAVGDRGARLSGGQRQRIAIARAFLKDAPILLLDEATSALDSATEAVVQAALDKLMKGRTVVAIAHRLSTLQSFDRIVVIQHGRLVDDGTPGELAHRAGIYRDVLLRHERRAAGVCA